MSNKILNLGTIYVESGVASELQVSECLRKAIDDSEKILGYKTNCKFKVNLIVDKDGKYFGYGYIYVNNTEIFWMLLGKNPDGSERVEEKLDPSWKAPMKTDKNLSFDQIIQNNKKKTWSELAEEEDAMIQPKIKILLEPLVKIPGFPYDKEQIAHLKELAAEKGEPNIEIPEIGFFEISRAYANDPEPGLFKNRLCAHNVPDWIPEKAFKAIFSFYVPDKTKKGTIYMAGKEITDTYPIVNFVDTKKGSKIVFVTFDPSKNDAIFALLMTKKTRIINPSNPKQKMTLIFMHAYDNSQK